MGNVIASVLTIVLGVAGGFLGYKYYAEVRDRIRTLLKLTPEHFMFYALNGLNIELAVIGAVIGANIGAFFVVWPLGLRWFWMAIQVGAALFVAFRVLVKFRTEEKEFEERKNERSKIRVPEIDAKEFEKSTSQMMTEGIRTGRITQSSAAKKKSARDPSQIRGATPVEPEEE